MNYRFLRGFILANSLRDYQDGEISSSSKVKNPDCILRCPHGHTHRASIWGGVRTILQRDAMIIRVKADNGLEGFAIGPAHEEGARRIIDRISEYLIGKDPLSWEHFAFPAESSSDQKPFHAIEVAIPDLTGRYEECSVS